MACRVASLLSCHKDAMHRMPPPPPPCRAAWRPASSSSSSAPMPLQRCRSRCCRWCAACTSTTRAPRYECASLCLHSTASIPSCCLPVARKYGGWGITESSTVQEFIIKYRVQQALIALANGQLAANQASTGSGLLVATHPAVGAPYDSVLTLACHTCCCCTAAGACSKAGPEPARSIPGQCGVVSLWGRSDRLPARH